MCELFAFSAKDKENVTPYLIEFYSHSDDNPHGWGLADVHGPLGLETQEGRASNSRFLPHLLKDLLPTDLLLAHIRRATVGKDCAANCHPFEARDASGTTWTFMHNGTIFEGDVLGKYQAVQRGTTDSERILLYLIDQVDTLHDGNPGQAGLAETARLIEDVIHTLAPGNKLNLVFTDGTRLYIHINMDGTLYRKRLGSGLLFATTPLDDGEWDTVEQNRLLIYERGEQIYRGARHEFTYVPAGEAQLSWLIPTSERGGHETDPLGRAVWQKYVLPTQREPQDFVGVELEYPIVNLSHGPVDFDLVHEVSLEFADRFGMDRRSFDDEGNLYSAYSTTNGDDLSFDCSYNTLEFSFGRERDINALYHRFCTYYPWIQERLRKSGHMITGLGINPGRRVNANVPVRSERYRMLLHYLSTCTNKDRKAIPQHAYPNFGLFSCASQVQLDVGQDQIADVLNVFDRLEPLKSVLFANSYLPEEDLLLSRDFLWNQSAHGINPHNTGMYGMEFHDTDEVTNYIRSMSIYSMERGGKYINFYPIPLYDYLSRDYVTGEYFDGSGYAPITFAPQPEDLRFVRTFKLNDLTFRGTVEFRSVCEQPVSDVMACAAFHAGLKQRYDLLADLLGEATEVYGKGFSPVELRRDLNGTEWPSYLDRTEVSHLLTQVLDLASDGLRERGLDEQHFIEPLYRRAETLESPALHVKRHLDAGGSIDDLIQEYAEL